MIFTDLLAQPWYVVIGFIVWIFAYGTASNGAKTMTSEFSGFIAGGFIGVFWLPFMIVALIMTLAFTCVSFTKYEYKKMKEKNGNVVTKYQQHEEK